MSDYGNGGDVTTRKERYWNSGCYSKTEWYRRGYKLKPNAEVYRERQIGGAWFKTYAPNQVEPRRMRKRNDP